MLNTIKMNKIYSFRQTLKEILKLPEMDLSPYIIKKEISLSQNDFSMKYLFSETISNDDLALLIAFLKEQLNENKAEIAQADSFDYINTLITKLNTVNNSDIHLEAFKTMKILENERSILIKGKPHYKYYLHNQKAFAELIHLFRISGDAFIKGTGKSRSSLANLMYSKTQKFISDDMVQSIKHFFDNLIQKTDNQEIQSKAIKLIETFLDYNDPAEKKVFGVRIREQKIKVLDKLDKNLKKPDIKTDQSIPLETNIKKSRWESTLYTEERKNAFCTIIDMLKITPKLNKLPIAQSHFFCMKSGIRNGKSFNISFQTLNKMIEYFIPILKDKLFNLSHPEQQKLKENFEIYLQSEFPKIADIFEQVKIIDNNDFSLTPDKEVEILSVQKLSISNISNEELDFINNHGRYFKKKKEIEQKIEMIISEKNEQRYIRDRKQKIDDAISDIDLFVTLALSKQKKFIVDIFEIKDFIIESTDKYLLEKMIPVKCINEDGSEITDKETFLSKSESDNYSYYENLIKQNYDNVEVKLKLKKDQRLFMVFHYTC